jgi:hypothetical protein
MENNCVQKNLAYKIGHKKEIRQLLGIEICEEIKMAILERISAFN